jgi:hypothetical protein
MFEHQRRFVRQRGDGLVLRVWNQAGKDGDCTIALPEGFHADAVQPCDLRGRAQGAPIPVCDGVFTFRLKGDAPASFLLAGS